MTFRNKIILLLSLVLWFQCPAGYAKGLDVFKSSHAFPMNFVYLPERIPNLESLRKEDVAKVLQWHLEAAKKIQSHEKRNLHNLAVGFLYLKKGDYNKAVNYLQNNIIGNFILDDFKISFQAAALKELARQKLEEKKFTKAIDYLHKTIDLWLKIYQSFPASPFYSTLPRDLAETERLLGDAYYQSLNYKAAWQAYRKALMRDFPGNDTHRLEVYLSLAKTYESANNLQEAVDIYVHLASSFGEPEVKKAITHFIKKYEKPIREKEVDAEILLAAYPVQGNNGNADESRRNAVPLKVNSQAAGPPPSKSYENDVVRKFYESMKQGNHAKTFKRALAVLRDYPGMESTGKIIKDVNRLIAAYIQGHPWNADIGKITDYYPAQTLRTLAYDLWRNLNADAAAIIYKKILNKYPLETKSCHKALYFLGRIYEDKKEYGEAIQFYDRLLRQYDQGKYTTAALFKIPWLKRRQGRHKEAIQYFNDNLDFYSSSRYDRLQSSFPGSSSYLAATRYWLAQTAGKLENSEEKKFQLEKLIEESPFDFYAVISRVELGLPLKEFFSRELRQPLADRMTGLGELQRKRLKRAEKLIAAGFMNSGIQELFLVTARGTENLPFLFYLSRLFYLAGEYHKAIKLSWKVVGQEKVEFVSSDLAKNLFPQAFLGQVNFLARKSKLNPMLVLSLIRQESGFNPEIVSSANAVGLMQLLPDTARQVARLTKRKAPDYEDLKIPKVNLLLGIEYLRRLLLSFDQKTILALAAYNAGPKRVGEWIDLRSELDPLEFMESIPYKETRNYVKKVLRNYCIYLALYKNREIKSVKEILTISAN